MSYADIERIRGNALVQAAQIRANALMDAAETARAGAGEVADTNAQASMWNGDVRGNALRDVANTGADATKFAATEGKEGHLGAASITGKYGVQRAEVENAGLAALNQARAREINLSNDFNEAMAARNAYHTGALNALGVPDTATLKKNPDLQKLYDTYKPAGDLNGLSQAHDNYQWYQTHAPNVDNVIQYAADKGYPIAPAVQNQIRAGVADRSPNIRSAYGPLFEDYARNNPTNPSLSLSDVAKAAMGNPFDTGGSAIAPAVPSAPSQRDNGLSQAAGASRSRPFLGGILPSLSTLTGVSDVDDSD